MPMLPLAQSEVSAGVPGKLSLVRLGSCCWRVLLLIFSSMAEYVPTECGKIKDTAAPESSATCKPLQDFVVKCLGALEECDSQWGIASARKKHVWDFIIKILWDQYLRTLDLLDPELAVQAATPKVDDTLDLLDPHLAIQATVPEIEENALLDAKLDAAEVGKTTLP